MTSRIDIIGQNGADGKIYLVEDIAKIIYASHKINPRYNWEDFVEIAIKIVERIEHE